ncbi:MAG: chromate transporter, partial [Betaproteobacteria bacterium]|nr:chromate transporter [Betaproteobacteria bacterium]
MASGNPGALPQAIALRRVFIAFFRLGLSSFGGPIAHLAYFRTEFVDRRRWLGDAEFAELLALCQFLPGPASSQLGMA